MAAAARDDVHHATNCRTVKERFGRTAQHFDVLDCIEWHCDVEMKVADLVIIHGHAADHQYLLEARTAN